MNQLKQIYHRFSSFTMVRKDRYLTNLELVRQHQSVPGAIVECGTWKGGMIAGVATLIGNDRAYHLYDSFAGLPQAQPVDGDSAVQYQLDKDHPKYYNNCTASIEDARNAMSLANVDQVTINKGWFEDTLSHAVFSKGIAILVLDADWYDSTMQILSCLFHQVNRGGLILIDDYFTWDGCSKAVHDFLSENDHAERIQSAASVAYIKKRAPSREQALQESINSIPFTVGIAVARNDEDIIEQFVRHNLDYLDLLVVLVEDSKDATERILGELALESLPLMVIDNDKSSATSSQSMTMLLQNVEITLRPDFIVLLDADEFISCPTKKHFIETLQLIQSPGKGLINVIEYIACTNSTRQPTGDPLRDMVPKEEQALPIRTRTILRLDGRLVPGIGFAQHEVNPSFPGSAVTLVGVTLARFPFSNRDQTAGKIIADGLDKLAMESNAASASPLSNQSRTYSLLCADPTAGNELLSQLAPEAPKQRPGEMLDISGETFAFRYRRLRYAVTETSPSWYKVTSSIEDRLPYVRAPFLERFREIFAARRGDLKVIDKRSSEKPRSEIFDDSWHLENLFFDTPPFKDFYNRFYPTTVLDVGCGMGQYLLYFKDQGSSEVLGVDGIAPEATLLGEGEYIQQDLNSGIALGRTFDLVMCLEVVEHMNEQDAFELLKCLATHAERMILFSAASPGQPGNGHVNCQPIRIWLDKWAELGWEPLPFDSLRFRLLASFNFFKKNPVVLVRQQQDKREVVSRLIRLGDQPFMRWEKPKGIMTTVLNPATFEHFDRSVRLHLGQESDTRAKKY